MGMMVARALDGHDARHARTSKHIALLARSCSTMACVSGCMRMVPSAMAMRWVSALSDTSTIRTRPSGVHVRELVATGVTGGLGGSTGSRLRGRVGVASIRRSRDFVGRHRGPASGLGGIGVPALGHIIILRFGT